MTNRLHLREGPYHDRLEVAQREHLAAFFERLGRGLEHLGEAREERAAELSGYPTTHEMHELRRRKVENLDRTRVFLAMHGEPVIRGVNIEPGRPITAAVTVRLPPELARATASGSISCSDTRERSPAGAATSSPLCGRRIVDLGRGAPPVLDIELTTQRHLATDT